MKKLILITLVLGLSSYIYAGCSACGPEKKHDHDHSKVKACDSCGCSKERSACDKKEKSSCGGCSASEKKSSCSASK
jgi:hypothetical protein